MVGDLGSQVEHAAVVSHDNHPLESSTMATSSDMGWPDHHGEPASGNPRTTGEGEQTASAMAAGTLESPQLSDEFGELAVASNGDLIVGNRFWTVFCNEVRSSSATFGFAVPTKVKFVGRCAHAPFSLTFNRGGTHLRSRPRAHSYPL